MGIKGYRNLKQERKDAYLAYKREYMRKWRAERKNRNSGNKQEGLNRLGR